VVDGTSGKTVVVRDGSKIVKPPIDDDAFLASMSGKLGSSEKLKAVLSRYKPEKEVIVVDPLDPERRRTYTLDFRHFLKSMRGTSKFNLGGSDVFLCQTQNSQFLIYTEAMESLHEKLMNANLRRKFDLNPLDGKGKPIHMSLIYSDDLKVIFSAAAHEMAAVKAARPAAKEAEPQAKPAEADTLVPDSSEAIDLEEFKDKLASCRLLASLEPGFSLSEWAGTVEFVVSSQDAPPEEDHKAFKSGSYIVYAGEDNDLYSVHVNCRPPVSKTHVPFAQFQYGTDICIICREVYQKDDNGDKSVGS